jgi:large subunit ribosomal protein L15
MELFNNLTKITDKSAKRVGRGIGSTKGGHTTGRGVKGDTIRGKTKITFDGTKIKKGWIKRLPFLRGKHRVLAKPVLTTFDLGQIDKWFKSDEVVDLKSLSKKSKLNEYDVGKIVKILAKGKLTKALSFEGLLFSEGAKKQILSNGGKID